MACLDQRTSIHNRKTSTQTIKKTQCQSHLFRPSWFSDASSHAYGAVVYLRTVYEDTSISTSLIYSKSRVVPLKKTTMHRLELSAALLLARILTYLKKVYGFSDIFAWSDSEIVLSWLQRPPTAWKTYVAHRVAAIQEAVPASKWRHVPTKDNPADLLSRGIPLSLLPSNRLWWDGPTWLALSPQEWPKQKKRHHLPSDPEIKQTNIAHHKKPAHSFILQLSRPCDSLDQTLPAQLPNTKK